MTYMPTTAADAERVHMLLYYAKNLATQWKPIGVTVTRFAVYNDHYIPLQTL